MCKAITEVKAWGTPEVMALPGARRNFSLAGIITRERSGSISSASTKSRVTCNNSTEQFAATHQPGTFGMVTTKAIHHGLQCRLAACAITLMLGALGGCIAYSPGNLQLGQSEPDVISVMGPPTGLYALPDGARRLEFARGPAGQETFMVDFDVTGRMVSWRQVLNLQHFSEIEPGTSAHDLLMRIGHPASTMAIPRQQLVLWNYRYPTNDCLWYQFSVGFDGRVISGSTGIDPRCDPPNFLFR